MVKGVGSYGDYEKVADTWMATTPDNFYQIFGHRNTKDSPVKLRDRVFNLEGRVEFGGNLRVVELTHEGFHTVEIKNTVFRPKEEFDAQNAINSSDVAALVLAMRKDKHIQEKKFGHFSSFNFTRDAFVKNIWNKLTVHARGLFIDIDKMKIIIKSYNKFFYLGQSDCPRFNELSDKLVFPVNVYLKENGFLGLLSYNEYEDDLLFATKSSLQGDFISWFIDAFYGSTAELTRNEIKKYIKENNVTFLFEVICPATDPHIIQYSKANVVLLDVVKNQIEFSNLPYEELFDLSTRFMLSVKKRLCVLNDWTEFCNWYDMVTEDNYTYDGEYIEGFVVTDANNFMFKQKTEYYNFWKKMRGIVQEVWHKGYIEHTARLTGELDNKFYGFIKKMYESTQDKAMLPKDIITLRNMFYETEYAESKELH